MDARRLDGFGQAHPRQGGREAAGQHRRAGPRGANEQVMGRTPQSSAWLMCSYRALLW
jgi:hypothetical protein